MTRRIRIPMLIVLLLLVGTAEGPRMWPGLIHAVKSFDGSLIASTLQRLGDAIAGWLNQGAAMFEWTTLAFSVTAGVLFLATGTGLVVIFWPSRRSPRVRRGSRRWTRRHEVGHRARAGESVPVIARETRLSQDAIRTLIASR